MGYIDQKLWGILAKTVGYIWKKLWDILWDIWVKNNGIYWQKYGIYWAKLYYIEQNYGIYGDITMGYIR